MSYGSKQNPYFAGIELKLGERVLSKIPPEHILSFTHSRNLLDTANKFQLSVIDVTALELERVLVESMFKQEQDFTIQYGYFSEGILSKEYLFFITDFTPSFSANGVTLAVEGMTPGVKKMVPKTETWLDGNFPMPIHEIVRRIADEEGWMWTPETIPETDEVSAEGNNYHIQNNIPNITYITTVLAPLAKKKSSPDSDFVLWFDDSTSSTQGIVGGVTSEKKITVYFRPLLDEAAAQMEQRTYTWNIDRESQVLSFSPSYRGVLLKAKYGRPLFIGIDRDGEINEVAVDFNTDDDNLLLTEEEASKGYSLDEDEYNIMDFSRGDPLEMYLRASYLFYKFYDLYYQADLVLKGDPTIIPNSMINVYVEVVASQKSSLESLPLNHHSSGSYMIREIEDSISGGTFETTLRLFRNTSTVGKEKHRGRFIGSPVNPPARGGQSISKPSEPWWPGQLSPPHLVNPGSSTSQ